MYHDPEAIDSRAHAGVTAAKVVDVRAGPLLPLVLLVDDNADARSILAEILQRRGFRTAEAEDGETGIDLAFSAGPDVILMDHSMPGMSGLEAARRIKRDLRTRTIPIVMLTGSSSPRTRGSSPDCDAYIVKPSMPDEIAATLRTVLATGAATIER
jgi:two-component system phosphate regulon response regulator PhoB